MGRWFNPKLQQLDARVAHQVSAERRAVRLSHFGPVGSEQRKYRAIVISGQGDSTLPLEVSQGPNYSAGTPVKRVLRRGFPGIHRMGGPQRFRRKPFLGVADDPQDRVTCSLLIPAKCQNWFMAS